jgi:hypothetical protein
MLGSSWVAAQLTASDEGLSSISVWVSELIYTLKKQPEDSSEMLETTFSSIYNNLRVPKYELHFWQSQ